MFGYRCLTHCHPVFDGLFKGGLGESQVVDLPVESVQVFLQTDPRSVVPLGFPYKIPTKPGAPILETAWCHRISPSGTKGSGPWRWMPYVLPTWAIWGPTKSTGRLQNGQTCRSPWVVFAPPRFVGGRGRAELTNGTDRRSPKQSQYELAIYVQIHF